MKAHSSVNKPVAYFRIYARCIRWCFPWLLYGWRLVRHTDDINHQGDVQD